MNSISANFSVKVDARKLGVALNRLPPDIRRKVARKGLREWGKRVVREVKRGVLPQDEETRRDVAVKVKSYRKGKVIWAGVGVRKDGLRVGWRSHFWDGGFRVWQKGMKADGTMKKAPTRPGRNPNPRIVPFSQKRGWRDGLSKRGLGQRIGRRLYIQRPKAAWLPKADEYVRDAIMEALRGH